ncbi:homocysteine S-methyltransferase family protein [Gimesia maris]|uniref:SGNH/GDSL hydrolase family protein n=1 Tax=Gimesia maris TaxID=122 RepID=A0ABX5YNQ3_9PLAN|nr:homocysteine S-methyltransferase family protein [Gimesia maris]EDL62207.1 hypothetical protein PM8797T_27804 [Gimesia maris DSM 8797]QEG17384.1 hypothetical protein GmarT_32640 [Gimesia maris]QGQ29536.1 hypothetical protein F1729_13210 [Gimesia maris]
MKIKLRMLTSILCLCFISVYMKSDADAAESDQKETLNVLFIGNSYTARHNLAQVVKKMAEAGHPKLTFKPTTVIYGGRRLVDHWNLGSQNYVKLDELTSEEEKQTITGLQKDAKDPRNRYAAAALKRHQKLLKELDAEHPKWDVVVLQSYRDDLKGADSLYAQYAPRFAELAKKQGARVILYETTPNTQNAKALKNPPVAAAAVMQKAKAIAALAKQVDASAAPMSLAGFHCQTERPDLTLRFINDAHLNQTMAYLTACCLYAALFDRSPEGLPVDSITDIRYFDNKDRTKDRDGNPITTMFSAKDRADLQRIAWKSYQQFKTLRDD